MHACMHACMYRVACFTVWRLAGLGCRSFGLGNLNFRFRVGKLGLLFWSLADTFQQLPCTAYEVLYLL